MRPFLLLFISPIIRAQSTRIPSAFAFAIPAIEYPVCRRNFTCAAPTKQHFQSIMTDLGKEKEVVERLQEPASGSEGKILEQSEREKALKDIEAESSASSSAVKLAEKKVEAKKEEVVLPKLSAAEFRAFNSMAEHMEYFVSCEKIGFLKRQELILECAA